MSQVNSTINNDLITINTQFVNNLPIDTVNARDLHDFLEIGKEFANWIKDRIDQYDFTENQDYCLTIAKTGKRQNVVLKEYHITLDMAKELSMVERNAKGKEARKYFIEAEKQLKEIVAVTQAPKELSRKQILSMALEAEQKSEELLAITNEQHRVIEKKDALIEHQKPLVKFAEVITEGDATYNLREGSKQITNKNPAFTPNKVTALLKTKGHLIMNEKGDYMPSASMTLNGYMKYTLKRTWYDSEAQKRREQWQVRITGKGLEMLLRLCNAYEAFFDYKFGEYEYFVKHPHSQQTKNFLTAIKAQSK